MKPLWQQQQEQMRKQQEQMRRQQEQQRQQEQMRKQQEQMRKQQDQMLRQQEVLRRQQMGAAWLQQQKTKKKQPGAPPQGGESDRFAQVEEEVAKLRQDLAAGRLSEEQFNARLRNLMVQDEAGSWWMLGYETGEWYRHDGTNWVRADPPREQAVVSPKPKRHWFSAIAVFIVGLVIVFVAGIGVGNWTDESLFNHAGPPSFICASAVWIVGLILTIRVARGVSQPR